MGAPSKLGKSERQAAVLALLRREEPAQVLARRYGVSEKTLYSWRDVFLAAGQAALADGRSTGGDKRQIGGQERGSFRGVKAPEKGPPQRTDVVVLETVPAGNGQKGC